MALPNPLRFLLLFILTTTTLATSILTVTIPPSNPLPNPNSLPAGTHATLTSLPSSSHPEGSSGQQHKSKAPLSRSGSFTFHALPKSSSPTSYLLDIRSAEYIFAPYRVDLSADGTVLGIWETFRGNPWDNRGAEKFLADVSAPGSGRDVTVEAKVLSRRGFYEERSTFSPLALFKNPMILLALVALGFTFGMPKLMENMDPEMRAEFEKQSRASPVSGAARGAIGGGGGPANFDLAGWMAGTGNRPAAAAPATEVDSARGGATGRESGGATRRR
ncbi:hypothetical protein BDW42DRAFT_177510 [Aspergillus taichungensis]|uniref:ER membrane protein complex subunit 7 beta-sandwich domain-containing protein n=1 Tax=Aspergillus taichungensis TaxID=482145 RepID=A0A2J5HJ48_9EURO|nr:hypothetical protein BDW42DRAFT_177510 [Aspergillus taichungensis]